jgi:aspartyl-tRNA(Asn)/glutamyl-tRNA(Gln) amidotransferase subunit A
MLLTVISGHDSLDTTSADVRNPDYLGCLRKGVRGIKIGLPKEYFVEGLDSVVKEQIMHALALLHKNGAEVIDISLPHTKYAISSYYLVATAEASSNLARYDGARYGFRSKNGARDVVAMYEASRTEGFGREVKRRIMLGTYALSAGYYDAYYTKAQQTRALVKADFDKAFEKVNCIITPVSPCLPFRFGERIAEPLQMYLVDIYTASANLSGLPAMTVGCGAVGGLPVGLQIIGKPFNEKVVMRVGHAYEQMAGNA